jgi:AcrR family transcriptional regulator
MELKERILEGASTLFSQKGIKSITMSDIANKLGISKRTLYEVFRDKEELLDDCINAHIEKTDREVKSLVNNSDNVIDTLMRIYAKHLNEAKSVNKVVHDLRKYHPRIFQKIECKQKEGVDTFVPLFKKGVEQGLLRDDVNFEIVLWLFKSQFKVLMDDDYIPTDKYSSNEIVRTIIVNFIRGIVTRQGSERIDNLIEQYNQKAVD